VFRVRQREPFWAANRLFTASTELAIRAVRSLRTARHHQRLFDWRTDQLAYGGVKDSGIGREGPKYSIRRHDEERWCSSL